MSTLGIIFPAATSLLILHLRRLRGFETETLGDCSWLGAAAPFGLLCERAGVRHIGASITHSAARALRYYRACILAPQDAL